MASPRSSMTVRRIGPERDAVLASLGELWASGGLVRAVTLREIRVRYKQTLLGVAWAVTHPLMLMLIFTVIFSRFVRVGSDGFPYPLFSYCALLPWTFIANSSNLSMNCLVANVELVTKVWFPREALPIASVVASLLDFSIAMLLLLGLFVWFGHVPGLTALYLLPLIVLQLALTLGIAFLVSAASVRYRDFKFIVPLGLQVWMYGSPIIYPLSKVPEALQPYYRLNPMVGLIEGYRSALLRGAAPDLELTAIAALGAALVLCQGWLYFHHEEKYFADVI